MELKASLTAQNILSLFDTNKAQRKTFCEDVVNKLKDGIGDPLKVHIYIKAMEEIINSLTNTDKAKNKNFELAKVYKELLLAEAEKNGGKTFSFHNAEFTIKEAGQIYDFTVCNSLVYNEMFERFSLLKIQVKAQEEFLKKLPIEGLVFTDEITGDTYKIYPPSKKSTTTVAVSLK